MELPRYCYAICLKVRKNPKNNLEAHEQKKSLKNLAAPSNFAKNNRFHFHASQAVRTSSILVPHCKENALIFRSGLSIIQLDILEFGGGIYIWKNGVKSR